MKFLNYKNLLILLLIAIFLIIIKFFYSAPLSNKKTAKKIIFLETNGWVGISKGLESLYKEMKQDGHDVKVANVGLSLPKTIEEEDIIYPCGKSAPYKCQSLARYKPDYIITQNPYHNEGSFNGPRGFEIEDDYHLSLNELKATGAKVMYIPYGPSLFYQTCLDLPYLSKIMDIVFVDSYMGKKKYEKHFNFSSDRVIISGYQTYNQIRQSLGAREIGKKETILWLPRWLLQFTFRDQYEGGSTFLNYHYFFYNYALENPNINFIIRPHTNLVRYAVLWKFATQKEIDEIFNRFKSLPNVRVSEHSSNSLVDDILESDIVIGDGTTSLAEAVVADKPIIYLSNGLNLEFNTSRLTQEFKKYIYFAYSPDDIISNIEKVRKNHYLPFDKQPVCKTFRCKIGGIRREILRKIGWISYTTYTRDEFKKMLDPIDYPAKFISNYLLNLPKDN